MTSPKSDAVTPEVDESALLGGRVRLLQGTDGYRAGMDAALRLLPALILHDRSGAKHTLEAEAILRGEAGLEL